MLNLLPRITVALAALIAFVLGGMPNEAKAQTVNLPDANCGATITDNCLVFGDFTVYSLGLLSFYQKKGAYSGFDFTYKPSEAIVTVIDGAGQGTSTQGSGTGIDDPFRGMNSSTSDNMLFVMSATSLTTGSGTIPSDPAGTPTYDNQNAIGTIVNSNTFTQQEVFGNNPITQFADQDPNTQGTQSDCFSDMNTAGCILSWDADVADLTSALGGAGLVFMFNNNETGDSGTLDGQNLLAWGRVTLCDANNANCITFTLDGNGILPQQGATQTANVDDTLPTANDIWANVHAEICVNQNTGEVFLGECSASGFGQDGVTVNQALGADEAGFAITSATLNSALYSALYTGGHIAVDIRFSHINNGSDNVWIMAGTFEECPPTDPNCVPVIPEPGTLALGGLALTALAATRRRKNRTC